MNSNQIDELMSVFEDLLHSYREAVTNRFVEEMTTTGDPIVDKLETVNLIETKSVEYEFKERFKADLEEILGNE